MSLISLTIDQREPDTIQSADYGMPPLIGQLSAGSAWCVCDDGALLAIWRLDAGDLLHAIRQDTLKAQAIKLRGVTPWAYLFVQGLLTPAADGRVLHNDKPTGWTWGSVQGALMTLQEIGICVLTIGTTARQFADALRRTADRNRGPARTQPLRDVLFPSPAELILTAIPGIGHERAEALLAECGSAAWALAALTGGDCLPSGIAGKTVEAARASLGLTAGQIITVHMQTEEASNGRKHTDSLPAAHPRNMGADRADRPSRPPIAAVRG